MTHSTFVCIRKLATKVQQKESNLKKQEGK